MQKAELELPVKQFHQLYDLLGDILDHESETNDFNMENSDIELIEDIRNELFNQIPDEEPTETTYAFTTAISGHSVTPLKLYEVKKASLGNAGFIITNDRRSEVYCIEKGCSHLSPDQSENWNLITITNK
jgi:hypothetical protein